MEFVDGTDMLDIITNNNFVEEEQKDKILSRVVVLFITYII